MCCDPCRLRGLLHALPLLLCKKNKIKISIKNNIKINQSIKFIKYNITV